ncbi:signal peptidase I [Ferroacidibacillus organovorans]|uniref:signal peptidase I n=1 Tax=Ferroacidibacillus organovorans TaxID=1765683 RepID=UPI000A9C5112|nr:signal peptidase I [Ferroacidibacillus organovorans]
MDDQVTEETQVPAPKKGNQKKDSIWDWVKAGIVALIIAFGIHQFLFTQFRVDGQSMDYTLANGERLIVDKIPYYFGMPKRGDIIVFLAPDGQYWVKRVIGLPGDTIQIKNGQLILNGKIVKEPFIAQPMDPSMPFGPVKVPPGRLFVMGDNRNISEDSRVIGPIKISSVVGRVDLVIWPLNKFEVIGSTQEHFLPQTP